MIVGWRVAANMRTDMVLDALEMARWSRGAAPRRAASRTPMPAVAIHVACATANASPSSAPALDRHGRRQLRQRAGRDHQRALQDRAASTDPTPAAWDDVDDARARHPRLGALVQRPTGSTATSATSRPPSSKQRSTLPNRPTRTGLESNSPSLHQTQGGSRKPIAWVRDVGRGGPRRGGLLDPQPPDQTLRVMPPSTRMIAPVV